MATTSIGRVGTNNLFELLNALKYAAFFQFRQSAGEGSVTRRHLRG